MKMEKLINCCSFLSGGTPDKGKTSYWKGVLPWFSPKDLKSYDLIDSKDHVSLDAVESSATRLINPGTILIVVRSGVLAHTLPVGIIRQLSTFNQDIKAIIPNSKFLPDYVALYLKSQQNIILREGVKRGATVHSLDSDYLEAVKIPEVGEDKQRQKVLKIRALLAEVDALASVTTQERELATLSRAIVYDSLKKTRTKTMTIGACLDEVKFGVGEQWMKHLILGATRSGLAPARERPGKHAERYKPVTAGTVFYNPMRILIGSIAFVDDDDEPGITSPDYVVLKGKPGVVDSRWFYYWLRSPLGERCIQSLARGAVRERMLFNRLAEGEIELPDYETQVKASKALAQIKPMRAAIQKQLAELELLPQKLLAQVFES